MPLIVIESLRKKRKGRWGQGERRDKGHAGSHHNNKAAPARHSENIQSEGSRCMHDVPCRSAGLPVRWSAGHLHQNHQESLLKILAPGLYPTPAHSDCWGWGPRTCMCSELPRWFLYTLTFENCTLREPQNSSPVIYGTASVGIKLGWRMKGRLEEFFHVGPMKHRYSGNNRIWNGIHHLYPDKTFLGKRKRQQIFPRKNFDSRGKFSW